MSFSRVQGQDRAARMLAGLIKNSRVPAAIIFSGMEGAGKSLMAREFSKALLCQERVDPAEPCGACEDCSAIDKGLHADVKLVDAVYQAGLIESEPSKSRLLQVDTIRHLRRDMELRSMWGRWKIAIVCDAHTMTPPAANALLKSLEEPQAETLWILLTARAEALPKTVRSRCFSVIFSPLPASTVESFLIARGLEKIQARRLAVLSEGSVSRALELAQLTQSPDALRASPLAAFQAADGLAKELPLARTQVELALFALAQDARLKALRGELTFAQVENPLRELAFLRQALRANADPSRVLTLAALETEGL